ncbi:sigma-70 family RNA polymerase sigma factor [Tepidibacter thalassicus]|uniref:RNA polymerase sigma factor, sigma-70 family n=1 Tax=Tepidibacter thalassicus DSM 15285 TaxID=1123350 RepID=A0A1M5S9G2_9FIRM|nr:sigma-70 family RNA polymerase sigma factor [Tepidibacter thalassicus]SHH35105.1 RNA polymerase sigma factor, sigma-70 family [Tepidibacter thalassicus DSM 15285]
MISIFGFPKRKKIREEEFQINYEKYYPIVYKQVYYLVGNNELAEDITQEVFIKYYNSKEKIDFLPSWLSKVATNTALNYLRGEKRRLKREESILEEVNSIFSIEDEIFRNEQIKEVRRILFNLPEKQRICLILKFSGYSYEEIHKATNIPKNSIGQIIARGKQKFLNLYKKEGDLDVL